MQTNPLSGSSEQSSSSALKVQGLAEAYKEMLRSDPVIKPRQSHARTSLAGDQHRNGTKPPSGAIRRRSETGRSTSLGDRLESTRAVPLPRIEGAQT